VRAGGRAVVEKLIQQSHLQEIKIIAAVSEDVDLHRQEQYLWGIFTRFDCARDVLFTKQKLIGSAPVYEGVMGIDATWKKGYPDPLVMDPSVVRRVDERWPRYGIS
jgi:4-hydroxy-3-polyprenylbenzoate decarboxylase